MNKSDTIAALAQALAKAQGEIEGAVKEKNNPHFNARYADLGAVWDAIRQPLANHGLSATQWLRIGGDDGGWVEVETMLLHSSGEWLSDIFAVPVGKRDAHGFGSAATYARRYSLMAAVGIAPVDDDANSAIGNEKAGAPPTRKTNGNGHKPNGTTSHVGDPPTNDAVAAARTAINGTKSAIEIGGMIDRIRDSEKLRPEEKEVLLEKARQHIVSVLQLDVDEAMPLMEKIGAARKMLLTPA